MDTKELDELEIRHIKFSPTEVLPSEELQSKRFNNLKKAMYLWNGFHEKSKIILKSNSDLMSIDAHVWFVSEKYVCLQAGITILVNYILDVII